MARSYRSRPFAAFRCTTATSKAADGIPLPVKDTVQVTAQADCELLLFDLD
jgi:hypothetical protein